MIIESYSESSRQLLPTNLYHPSRSSTFRIGTTQCTIEI